jgi:rhamnosyltransferase subunit B
LNVFRIVLSSWGSYGDLFPFIGLAIELRRRGHQPVIAMPEVYRPLVEREGVAFSGVRPDIDIHDRELAARVMDASRGPEVIFRDIIVPNLEASHEDLTRAAACAHAVVSHPATPAARVVAEEQGLCWISAVLAPMSFFSAYDPVTPPPAPWLQPLLARSPWIGRAGGWLIDRVTARWAEPIQRFRERRGLPRIDNPILGGQHSRSLVLAMFSKVLAAPQPDWPSSVCVTGASLYNGDASPTLPPDVQAFVDAGPAPIAFTLGTSAVAAAGQFYEISAAALARSGQRGVLLVGPHAGNRPRHVPSNVCVAEYAPHAPLFARSAAIVHQGGAGTLHQALASGKPMVVVPHSHDQPDNARRVTALGIAQTIYPRRYRVDTLERALDRVLSPACRARAEAVAQVVRTEDGPAAAADAIERVVRSEAPAPLRPS